MQNHDLHTKLNVPSGGRNAPVPTGHGICPVSVGACVMPPRAEMSLAEPVPKWSLLDMSGKRKVPGAFDHTVEQA